VPGALVGWAILLLPLAAHAWMVASLALARFEGQRLAKSVRIENYREAPIVWPGFDGPIGLQATFELHHPAGTKALILAPEIRMGPTVAIPLDRLNASLTSGSGYLKNTYLDRREGDLTLLKPVLFQRVFENRAARNLNYRWTSSVPFSDSTKTAMTFHLLPGAVDYLPSQSQICLSSRSYGVPACRTGQKPDAGCASHDHVRADEPVYYKGKDLSAIWMAAGGYDMTADLSRPLTAALRAHSRLQGDPAGWQAMQKRLEPAALEKAGYRICPPGRDVHTAFRICYCRPG